MIWSGGVKEGLIPFQNTVMSHCQLWESQDAKWYSLALKQVMTKSWKNGQGRNTNGKTDPWVRMDEKFDIIPEYSFVLGIPGDSEEQVWKQIKEDIAFIKGKSRRSTHKQKSLFISIVRFQHREAKCIRKFLHQDFVFLKHWKNGLAPHWENFDLRKNPLTPWLTPAMIDYIKNFETVLNGYFPTVSGYSILLHSNKDLASVESFPLCE